MQLEQAKYGIIGLEHSMSCIFSKPSLFSTMNELNVDHSTHMC